MFDSLAVNNMLCLKLNRPITVYGQLQAQGALTKLVPADQRKGWTWSQWDHWRSLKLTNLHDCVWLTRPWSITSWQLVSITKQLSFQPRSCPPSCAEKRRRMRPRCAWWVSCHRIHRFLYTSPADYLPKNNSNLYHYLHIYWAASVLLLDLPRYQARHLSIYPLYNWSIYLYTYLQ